MAGVGAMPDPRRSPLMRILLTLLAILAVLYLAACAAIFFRQRSMIYYPQPSANGTSAERMTLAVDGAELVVSVRRHNGPKALVYFGGNAEDVSANLTSLPAAFPDHAIYLMNYRGYGGSTGTPSEKALQQDALLLFDRVHAQHPQVTVMGRSLGSGLAVRLASERPVERVILVTPFESLSGLGAALFPHFPVRWLLTDKYESGRYAPRVTAPTLILAAENDEVIPRWSTEQLLACFSNGVATLKVVAGAGHNTISDDPAYWRALRGD
jgi:pimeloyl-ACP methyl ester carboxylesterase